MNINAQNFEANFSRIREKSSWNNKTKEELKMHKIHVYPAKFPSFLISKSLQYAKQKKIVINSVGDIFCGCGTTALEAKKNNKTFWGCDINPVATLIAKVKRENYNKNILQKHYDAITLAFNSEEPYTPSDLTTNERINYWFEPQQIAELDKLLYIIRKEVPNGKYKDFFLVAFSNILKKTSKWLTKSIKPTVNKTKMIHPVWKTFRNQFNAMVRAVNEMNIEIVHEPEAEIVNKNFLEIEDKKSIVDLLITSPPYVTSYEYADLHQLSTLWLGYTDDFRKLRKGTIGSIYHEQIGQSEVDQLNQVGRDIYDSLIRVKAKNPKSVVKYFLDMNSTIQKSYSLVKQGGLATFVIGNTKHKNVYINNAKYLTRCMLDAGFSNIEVFKRKISSKILTPYRDKDGKFSSDKRKRMIYSYEYVIIARKP